jgi:hypothetical protein
MLCVYESRATNGYSVSAKQDASQRWRDWPCYSTWASVSDGDSPKSVLYSTANRPSCQKP